LANAALPRERTMPNHVRFFAITADDVERARKFYEAVFGWTFEDWGPPDFYLIRGAGTEGALQKRQDALTGTGFRAFECTIGVDDVDDIAKRVVHAGGKVTMKKMRIETVGDLIWFEDTEGNRVGAMKYLNG
jgi:predicted enzyme related to lactoylglutathione lyase